MESPPGGWPRALGAVSVVFVLQLVLFQLAEEIGWTGFLQDLSSAALLSAGRY